MAASAASAPPARSSLADELSRIPDLNPGEDPGRIFGPRQGSDGGGGAGESAAARSSVRVDGRPPATSELELGPTPPRARRADRLADEPDSRASSVEPTTTDEPDSRASSGEPTTADGSDSRASSVEPTTADEVDSRPSPAEPTTAELFVDLSAASGIAPGTGPTPTDAGPSGPEAARGGSRTADPLGPSTDADTGTDAGADREGDTDTEAGSGPGPHPSDRADHADHAEPGGPLVAALASLSAEAAAGGAASPRSTTDTGSYEPVTIGSGVGGSRAAGGRRARPGGPADVPLWRRIGFALMIVVLVGSIPVLARTGYRIVTETTDGIYTDHTLSPQDPGYEVLVEPTPTALVIQTDDQGTPTSLTFVALNDDAGGSLVFIPLDTEVAVRAYGVDRLRTVYAAFADRPATARDQIADQVARILNVSIEEVIELDDRSWAQLVEPVGTLEIVNPDAVSTETHDFAAGPIELAPEDVGPYLNAATLGESDLSRLVRHQVLWRAWLDARARAVDPEEDPASSSAVGTVATHLASGEVEMATLPVLDGQDEDDLWVLIPDVDSVRDLMARAVPAPLAPVPGARVNVRLLNGVAAEPISPQIIGDIVRARGSITVLGNATSFDHDTTSIVYNDPAVEPFVDAIIEALGIDVDPRLDLEAPDTVDLTVTLGRDISSR